MGFDISSYWSIIVIIAVLGSMTVIGFIISPARKRNRNHYRLYYSKSRDERRYYRKMGRKSKENQKIFSQCLRSLVINLINILSDLDKRVSFNKKEIENS
jgi:hypothetical protein